MQARRISAFTSRWATHSTAWSPKRWPGSVPPSSTMPCGLSNSQCKHEPGPMHSQLTCVPHSQHAPEPCWCHWTVGARTTACYTRPSCVNSARWPRSCSPFLRYPLHVLLAGRMPKRRVRAGGPPGSSIICPRAAQRPPAGLGRASTR